MNEIPCLLLGTCLQVPTSDGRIQSVPIQHLYARNHVCIGQDRIGMIKHIYRVPLESSIACPIDEDLVVSYHQVLRKRLPYNTRKTMSWKRAGDLMKLSKAPESFGYLIVLEDGESIVRTRNWECLTIGHGVADDPIAWDPYWGTQSAISDLESFHRDFRN